LSGVLRIALKDATVSRIVYMSSHLLIHDPVAEHQCKRWGEAQYWELKFVFVRSLPSIKREGTLEKVGRV